MNTLGTEVGLLAVWDSKSLSHVDTMEDYRANFVADKSMLDLMNQGKVVVWGTGGDGTFDVDIRINPRDDLTGDEEKKLEMSAKNLKLSVTSDKVFVGSPESVGTVEEKSLQDKLINKVVGLDIGCYLVNLYFLFSEDVAQYVVALKKVSDDYEFPIITRFPQLG